jgi:hypothetical protein
MSSSVDARLGEQTELVGTVLHGRYEVLRRMGVGGMAAVYEGRRVGLERRVAIEVLMPHLAENPNNVRRFLREACVASVIGHDKHRRHRRLRARRPFVPFRIGTRT